jgi:hypothetical protein
VIDREKAHETARPFARSDSAFELLGAFRRRQQRWNSSIFDGANGRLEGVDDLLERSAAHMFVMMHRQRTSHNHVFPSSKGGNL